MPDARATPLSVSGASGVLPGDLSALNIPLLGGAGALVGATGWVFDYTGDSGAESTMWNLVYLTADGGNTWGGFGTRSPTGARDIFLEIFNGQSPDSPEHVYAGFHSDDANAWLGMANIGGVPKLGFYCRAGATSAPQPVAQQTITGSRGGRTAFTSLLAALGSNGVNLIADSSILGVAISRQIFNTHATSQTYTTPANCIAILVECVGAGGAGGGVATVASDGNIGQAGGGGAYSAKIITAPAASYTYTVGTGGTPGSAGANPGGAGGDTSFIGAGPVTLCLAKGGNGGAGTTALAGANLTIGATGGASGSGVGDLLLSGEAGFGGTQTGVAVNRAGAGGSPAGPYSSGGAIEKIATGTGNTCSFNGGGGGGGVIQSGSASVAGGSGGDGLIVVTEFY